MKREKIPSIEEIGKELQLDLSPLANRLVGKKIIEIEHCLIEVLATLRDWARRHWEYRRSAIKTMHEAESWREFHDEYLDYQELRQKMMVRFSIAEPIGRFFWAYREKLLDFEVKQEEAGRESTVAHARMMVAIIYSELELGFSRATESADEIEALWNKWMNSKEQAK